MSDKLTYSLNHPFGEGNATPDIAATQEDEINIVENALRAVMDTPEGRIIIGELLSWTPLYVEVFDGNSKDIHSKGQRSIGLRLVNLMNQTEPSMYPRLLLELANKQQKDATTEARKGKTDERTG